MQSTLLQQLAAATLLFCAALSAAAPPTPTLTPTPTPESTGVTDLEQLIGLGVRGNASEKPLLTVYPERHIGSATLPQSASPTPAAHDRPTTEQLAAMQDERWRIEREVQAEVDRATARIREVEADPQAFSEWAREWGGSYYCGDGLGVNIRILVGPDDELVGTWHGCMGLYAAWKGRVVEVLPDRLRLEITSLFNGEHMKFLEPEMFLVRWGKRRYIVPVSRMTRFCKELGDRGMERFGPINGVLKQLPDRAEHRLQRGVAEVPAEYRHLLGDALPEAGVTRVVSSTNREVTEEEFRRGWYGEGVRGNWRVYIATVELNAGMSAGFQVGDRLLVVDTATTIGGSIISAEESRSTARLYFHVEGSVQPSADAVFREGLYVVKPATGDLTTSYLRRREPQE